MKQLGQRDYGKQLKLLEQRKLEKGPHGAGTRPPRRGLPWLVLMALEGV